MPRTLKGACVFQTLVLVLHFDLRGKYNNQMNILIMVAWIIFKANILNHNAICQVLGSKYRLLKDNMKTQKV